MRNTSPEMLLATFMSYLVHTIAQLGFLVFRICTIIRCLPHFPSMMRLKLMRCENITQRQKTTWLLIASSFWSFICEHSANWLLMLIILDLRLLEKRHKRAGRAYRCYHTVIKMFLRLSYSVISPLSMCFFVLQSSSKASSTTAWAWMSRISPINLTASLPTTDGFTTNTTLTTLDRYKTKTSLVSCLCWNLLTKSSTQAPILKYREII